VKRLEAENNQKKEKGRERRKSEGRPGLQEGKAARVTSGSLTAQLEKAEAARR
jgi:hypothetical protein